MTSSLCVGWGRYGVAGTEGTDQPEGARGPLSDVHHHGARLTLIDHHAGLPCSCVAIVNWLLVSSGSLMRPSSTMQSISFSTRSCLRAPCWRQRAPLSSYNHVRVHCRPQSSSHVSSCGEVSLLQHSRGLTISSRRLASSLHHQPRSLLPAQRCLYSASSSSEFGADRM